MTKTSDIRCQPVNKKKLDRDLFTKCLQACGQVIFLLPELTEKPKLPTGMDSQYYEFDTRRGILGLAKSEESPGRWDFYINDLLIHSNYTDPEQAAYDFSKSDFGNQALNERFNKVYVPSDLTLWRRTKRGRAAVASFKNN